MNDAAVNNEEKKPEKPLYEKPRLIRLEDEVRWSRGGQLLESVSHIVHR